MKQTFYSDDSISTTCPSCRGPIEASNPGGTLCYDCLESEKQQYTGKPNYPRVDCISCGQSVIGSSCLCSSCQDTHTANVGSLYWRLDERDY